MALISKAAPVGTKASKKEPRASKKKEQSNESKKAKNFVIPGTVEQVEVSSGNASGKDSNRTKYVYHDFAKLPQEEIGFSTEVNSFQQDQLVHAFEEATELAAAQAMEQANSASLVLGPPPPMLRASGLVRSQRFPVKLYALLSQPLLASIITWLPHGRSWRVINTRAFEASVLPVLFESDNYHSFNRVINAWSFRRKSNGPDKGSYFHELFLRGKPHLQQYMRRLPRTHKKLAMAKDEEPDFYELEKTSPLPSLDEERTAKGFRQIQEAREQMRQDQLQVVSNLARLPFLMGQP